MAPARLPVARFFRWYADVVSSRPLPIMLLGAALVAVFTYGVQYMSIDSDPNLIWVPPGSHTAQQKAFFDASFDPFYRINQVIISLQSATGGNSSNVAGREVALAAAAGRAARRAVAAGKKGSSAATVTPVALTDGSSASGILTSQYLLAALALQTAILNGTAGDGTTLDDICFKPIAGKGCLVETPLDYFWSEGDLIAKLGPADVQGMIDCRVQPVAASYNIFPCWTPIHTPMLEDVVLGGIDCLHAPVPGFNASVCGGCGYYADALVLTFLTLDTPAISPAAAGWESDVFLPAVQAFSYPGLRASAMAQRSLQDEIAVVDSQNAWIVIISYLAMFGYIILALVKFPHPVHTRASLGLQGILVVSLSVVASIGIVSWSGTHITMIVNEVVPFLILALGVDNMFIITKAFDRHWEGPYDGIDPVPDPTRGLFRKGDVGFAMRAALGEVGPSITAAAFCEALAFGLGATTDIPALQQFCLVAAVAVIFDYFLQVTWFVGAVVLDAHRQRAFRLDVFPFIAAHPPRWWLLAKDTGAINDSSSGGVSGINDSRPPAYAPGSLSAALLDAAEDPADVPDVDKDTSHVTGLDATVHGGQYVRRVFEQYYAPALMVTPVRVAVLIAWLGLLAGSAYSMTTLRLGLEQQLVLPQGSYLTDYFNDQSLLGDAGPPLYLVLQNVNYTHPATAAGVESVRDALYTITRWVEPPIASWLSDFTAWNSPATAKWIIYSDCPVPYDSTYTYAMQVAQFLYHLPVTTGCCLQHSYCGAQYSTDVKFLWGVPKPRVNSSRADGEVVHAPVAHDLHGSPLVEVSSPPGAASSVDDGGCDTDIGYIHHTYIEAAARSHAGLTSNEPAPLDTHVHVSGAALLRALPPSGHAQLARGFMRRFGGLAATATGDASTTPHAVLAALSNVTFIPCHVFTSRLRTQTTPLHNQSDFIGVMQHVQAGVAAAVARVPGGGLPQVDLSIMGISSNPDAAAGALVANFTDSKGAYAYIGDNEHTFWINPAPGGAMFPYSLTFVYYEQYNFIIGVAVENVAVALAVVYGAALFVTASMQTATLTAILVASMVVNLIGFIAALNPHVDDPFGQGPYGVDINAVSVVNLVMAVGLSVEFCVHIASFFAALKPRGRAWTQADAVSAASRSLVEMGASVFTGITLTKLVGVTVLAWAPSHLFQLYYFRMYAGIILSGAFHGLVVLPVLLSVIGWTCTCDARRQRRRGGGCLRSAAAQEEKVGVEGDSDWEEEAGDGEDDDIIMPAGRQQ